MVIGGGAPGEEVELSRIELERLGEWVSNKRHEIEDHPRVAERLDFTMSVGAAEYQRDDGPHDLLERVRGRTVQAKERRCNLVVGGSA